MLAELLSLKNQPVVNVEIGSHVGILHIYSHIAMCRLRKGEMGIKRGLRLESRPSDLILIHPELSY